MIRRQLAHLEGDLRKPRASGDDPVSSAVLVRCAVVNPARAGMIPVKHLHLQLHRRKPRASGDDPERGEGDQFPAL